MDTKRLRARPVDCHPVYGAAMEDAAVEIEKLRDHGAFLVARLDEFEREISDDATGREWGGHVSPALERFRAALSQEQR